MKVAIAFVAEYLYIVIVALELLYLAVFRRTRWKEILRAAVWIGLIALVLSQVAHQLIQDPRPFLQSGASPLIPSSKDNGFPSDHTLLLGVSAAIVLTVSLPMGAVGLLAALAVGMARVYAGVHHTADILGSLLIALMSFGVSQLSAWAWSNRKRRIQGPGTLE